MVSWLPCLRLHYSPSAKANLCYYCSKGVSNQSSLGHRPDDAYVSTGFRNGKKATETFTAHQTSQTHQHYETITAHRTSLRGQTEESGNLYQLIKRRAEEDDPLLKWLTDRATAYVSPKSQNEILNVMANTIMRLRQKRLGLQPLFSSWHRGYFWY